MTGRGATPLGAGAARTVVSSREHVVGHDERVARQAEAEVVARS